MAFQNKYSPLKRVDAINCIIRVILFLSDYSFWEDIKNEMEHSITCYSALVIRFFYFRDPLRQFGQHADSTDPVGEVFRHKL